MSGGEVIGVFLPFRQLDNNFKKAFPAKNKKAEEKL